MNLETVQNTKITFTDRTGKNERKLLPNSSPFYNRVIALFTKEYCYMDRKSLRVDCTNMLFNAQYILLSAFNCNFKWGRSDWKQTAYSIRG